MRVDVRVLRCTGVGVGSIFAAGGGAGDDDGALSIVKEEVVGRFIAGWGERCTRVCGRRGLLAREEQEREDGEEEDGPENDGRGLASAAWGSGHDGSAIEIVGVEFVEKGTARTSPNLGRRNRSQRLLEYTERRASILGVPCARLASRKRRRGGGGCWDSWPLRRLPNATVLDVIPEVEEEEEEEDDHVARRLTNWKEECELMSRMNMVFAVGITGDMRIGYKYVPSLIKEILFPSPQPSPPPRKRRRIEDPDAGSSPDNNNTNELQRSLILETVKESYLLSPSVDSTEGGRKYDICLILEKEVVVEVDPVLVVDGEHSVVVVDDVVMGDVVPVQGLAAQTESTTLEGQPTEAISSSGSAMDTKAEDVNSKTETPSNTVEPPEDSQPLDIGDTSPHSTESSPHPPATLPKVSTDDVPGTSSVPEDHPPLPPPTTASDSSIVPSTKENEKVTPPPPPPPPHQPVQVLQRNLTESMFRFTWEGVKIVERSSDDGPVETEWAIQVVNWKWAPALR